MSCGFHALKGCEAPPPVTQDAAKRYQMAHSKCQAALRVLTQQVISAKIESHKSQIKTQHASVQAETIFAMRSKINLSICFALFLVQPAWQIQLVGQATQQEAPAQTKAAPDIKKSKLGTTKNVHQADKLFFAGQFTKDDLKIIGDAKVKRVITLRTDGEIDWDEQAAVEAAGMKFIKIPFRAPETLTDEVFDQIRKLLRDKSETTLFHCGSANRVGGVWLPFRVLDEGVDLKTALAEAKEIGLRTPFIEEKALDYIKRQQAGPVMNGEQSVKPGINKSFKDPDLSVDEMVQRFELESREIYLTRNDIVAACKIEKGNVVADVGAGTGLFTRLFSRKTGDDGWVFAVDIAPRLAQRHDHG